MRPVRYADIAAGLFGRQSVGTQGLWVMRPDEIVPTIKPYWDAGLDVRIRSNGDGANRFTGSAA